MALWQEKGRGWRYQFAWRDGSVKRRVTGKYYPTKREALAAMEAHKLALKEEGAKSATVATGGGREKITFLNLANAYLEDAERRFIRDTFEYKRLVYRRLLEHMGGDVGLHELTPLDIERFLRTRPTNTSYNRHRRELAALWSWAIARDLVQYNLISKVPKMPEDENRRHTMGPEEWEKILNHAGRAKPLLQVLYYTLGRIDEVLRLKWSDIDFENNTIKLATRKRVGGWRIDVLPMNSKLKTILQKLYKKRTQDEWVFLNPRTGTRYMHRPKLMRRVCQKAGLPNYGFHAIRHFAATQLHVNKGHDLRTVSSLLRHKNLRTTEIYLHTTSRALFEAVEDL